MVAEARARGLFLMEAVWSRSYPAFDKLRELLAAGAIVVPLVLVIGLPLTLATPWSVMLLYQPDITLWLIAMMLLSAGTAITQAVLVVLGLLRRRARSRVKRWRKGPRQPLCKISAPQNERVV